MASQSFHNRIQSSAKFLASATAQDARGYLDKPLETALDVLDCIQQEPRSYEEISEETGLALNTIKQVLQALKAGGYPLVFYPDESRKVSRTGPAPLVVELREG